MTLRAAISAIATAATLVLAPSAHAVIFTFTGDTTGEPTFNRPIEDLSALSAVGTAVSYDVFSFTVSVAGDYTFLTTGEFDTFTILYAGSFSAASPLTNAEVASDDLLSFPLTTSGLAATLGTGITYTYVTTAFGNADFGAYSTTIGGPGVVSAIPEPAGIAMFSAGLGLIGLLRRRQVAANG